MRLRTDIFVSAVIRQAEIQGAVAMLRRRGAAEAGAIFIKIDCLDGRTAIFGPAPQSEAVADGIDRLFTRIHAAVWLDSNDSENLISRQISFDQDLWLIEIEDRQGRVFVDALPNTDL